MSVRYYRVVPRRLRLAECRRLASDPLALLLLAGTKLGLPNVCTIPPIAVATRWHAAGLDDLSDELVIALRPGEQAMADIGFRFLTHGRLPLEELTREFASSLWLSPDRVTGVAVNALRVGRQTAAHVAMTSRFRDGTFGITANCSMIFDQPAEMLWQCHPGRPPEAVYPHHVTHLAEWAAEGRLPHPFADREGPEVSVELGRMQADVLVERGAWVPMTDAEVEAYLDAGN